MRLNQSVFIVFIHWLVDVHWHRHGGFMTQGALPPTPPAKQKSDTHVQQGKGSVLLQLCPFW